MVNNKTFKPALLVNRLRLWRSYLQRRVISAGFPLEIAIEITNRCNADCAMCSRRDMKRPIGNMDMGLFKKIIDEIKVYTELIWLHLAGEPLLHPEFVEMIRYAKSRGLKVGLSTNAISLDSKNSSRIIESGLDLLIISFDGASKDTYEKIRRLSNYEETLNNILAYLDEKSKKKNAPYTQVQFVYMDENKAEVENFIKMWRKTPADSFRFKPYFRFPDKSEELSGGVRAKNISFKPCFLLWRQCSIYWDGTVVSCCWDFLGSTPIGSAKEKTLAQIWNGEPMKLLRAKHLKGTYKDIDLCRNCNVPCISPAYLLGSIFIDDLSIKKLLPFFDNLSIVNKIKLARYYK